jgi:hypothetical protein
LSWPRDARAGKFARAPRYGAQERPETMTTTNRSAWRCTCVDACACDAPAPYELTGRAHELLAVAEDPQLARIDELVRGELARVAITPRGEL